MAITLLQAQQPSAAYRRLIYSQVALLPDWDERVLQAGPAEGYAAGIKHQLTIGKKRHPSLTSQAAN